VLAGIAPETGRELLGQIRSTELAYASAALPCDWGSPFIRETSSPMCAAPWKSARRRVFIPLRPAVAPKRCHHRSAGVGLPNRTRLRASGGILEALAGTVAASLQNAKLFESTKRTQEALRTSEAHFRRTFDLSPVGAVIAGEDFRFLRCNEAFCRFLGYTESELQQKSFLEVTIRKTARSESRKPGPSWRTRWNRHECKSAICTGLAGRSGEMFPSGW